MTPQEKLAALAAELRADARLDNGYLLHDAATGRQLEGWADRLDAIASEQGEVAITTDASGRCVAVTRQDGEGRILSVIWEASEHGGGGETVAWLRMTPNGEPDWAEDCIGSNDRFLDADLAADGYYLRPLTFADTTPPTPSAPVGVAERVRGIIALLRQPEPDNGEKRTEHDEGYEQASSEIADMLTAALTPAATHATPDDVALDMGPDDVPRLLIAGAQVARFPKGSWTEVCEAFDFGGYRNEQPAATPRGEESAPVVQMNNAPQIVPAASEDGLPERLEAEAARRESVWTDQPVMSPPTRFKHPTPLRNLLTEAAALIRRLAASGQGVEGWTIQVKCGGPDDERGIWAVDSEGSSIWLAAAPTQEKGNG